MQPAATPTLNINNKAPILKIHYFENMMEKAAF